MASFILIAAFVSAAALMSASFGDYFRNGL